MDPREEQSTFGSRLRFVLWGYEGEHSGRTVRRQTAVGLALQTLVALVLLLGGLLGVFTFDVATVSLAVNGLVMMVIVIWVAQSGRAAVLGREIWWRLLQFAVLAAGAVVLFWIVRALAG